MMPAALFRPGGDLYDCVPRIIDQLPEGDQHAATKVFQFLMRMELDGLLDERITDRFIADAIGYSERFVQKGLHALQHKLAELGQAIIDRMPNQGAQDHLLRPRPGPPARRPAQADTQSPSDSPRGIPDKDRDVDRQATVVVVRDHHPGDESGRSRVRHSGGACLWPDPRCDPGTGRRDDRHLRAEWVGRCWTRRRSGTTSWAICRCGAGGTCWGSLANWRREGGPPAPTTEALPASPSRRPSPEPAAPPSRLTAEEVGRICWPVVRLRSG